MNLREAKIHFIGIGGIGMSGIAELLANIGCSVTGSDLSANTQVEHLRTLGVKVSIGHRPENVPLACNAVVYSSAVKPSNLEIKEAKHRKIPIIQRAEMLSELMRLKRGIGISGTHGKTTTTSMVAALMLTAQLDPTIVVGGRLNLIKSTAALGKGNWLVAEADESDGSFLRLTPEIAVATNIDNDHLDHYGSFENLKKAFSEFLTKVPFYGLAILCVDDPNLAILARTFSKRMMTYGFSKRAALRAIDLEAIQGGQNFTVTYNGVVLGKAHLKVPGRHNVLNALAAIAVGLELKLDFPVICAGLADFKGVDRRLQVIGEAGGVTVIDDYAHHPTEVQATLEALRSAFPRRRLVVIFQPHRFSRTRDCWKQFPSCFDQADVLNLLDIYPAGEKPLRGISSSRLTQAIQRYWDRHKRRHPRHNIVGNWKNLAQALELVQEIVKEGDVLVTLGAGDVWKLGAEGLKMLQMKVP